MSAERPAQPALRVDNLRGANMPNFRRAYIPGGTFFFTLVTHHRARFLCEDRPRQILRRVFSDAQQRWPFTTVATVLLPDHLHAIWTLPAGDTAYPKRWGWIKKEFTGRWIRELGENVEFARSRPDRRRSVWQSKYWEHTVRDENELNALTDYIHYNPVKHGLARCPREWQWSTLHRFIREGWYPTDWGCPGRPSGPDDRTFAQVSHA